MIYLAETNLQKKKSVIFALNSVFGIGKPTSLSICKKLGFSNNFKIKDLSEEQYKNLLEVVKSLNLNLASDLKKINLIQLKKLVNIRSYRGLRKLKGLPIRGQRTHTNAKTARNRK
jgi:small subunit ribosomal protein S13